MFDSFFGTSTINPRSVEVWRVTHSIGGGGRIGPPVISKTVLDPFPKFDNPVLRELS